ncbi:MAG: phage tail tape measure protein, partial [Acidiferrobacterales bacterium]
MAVTAEQLNIILTARDREFSKAMTRNQNGVERFAKKSQKSLSKTSRSFAKLGGAMRGLLPALGAVALIAATKRVISNMDDIGKTADKLGLTTDALQEMRAAAESSGVAVATFDMAMQRFGRRVAEARQGTGEAVKALKEMGISLFDNEGKAKSLEGVFNDVADAMKGMSDQTDKNRLAMKLFDSEGVALVNLLRNGADGMAEMRQEARDLGVVIDESIIRRAEEAKTQLDLMSRVISANLSVALIELAPILIAASGAMVKLSGALASVSGWLDLITGGQIAEFRSIWDEINANNPFENGDDPVNEPLRLDIAPPTRDENGVPLGFDELIEKTLKQIKLKRENVRMSGMTADAIKRETIAKEKALIIDNFLALATAANMELSDDAMGSIQSLAEIYETQAIAALNAAKGTKKLGSAAKDIVEPLTEAELAALAFEDQLKSLGLTIEEVENIAATIQSSMEDAFMSMIDGTQSTQDAFRSMARDIIKELYRVLVVQQLVGDFKSGGGGILGGAFKLFGLGRAAGGPVQAGQPVTVGEHGRELFVPQQSGRILSVPQTNAAMGSSMTANVYVTNNFAEGVNTVARAEIHAATPRIVEAAKAGVLDAMRRG